MFLPTRLSAPLCGLALALALAACDTAEERAENHYQNALGYIEEGETDRAIVELRNVFDLDGNHNEARTLFAGLLRDRGDLREAYSQYLRLVEQAPDSLAGHLALAELALGGGNAEDADRHANRAYELSPDDPTTRALKAAVDYAGEDRDAALEMAQSVLEDDPTQLPAHLVIIADRVNAGADAEALLLIDAALEIAPEDEGLHILKLRALESMEDQAGAAAQLERMTTLFPENMAFAEALIAVLLEQDDLDGAEAALRAMAAQTPEDPAPALRVVQFLLDRRGPDAARAELRARAETAADPLPFQRALGALDFSQGNVDAGVAALETLIEGAEPSDARRDTQIALARMRAQTGDVEGRDALVEAVLAEDASHVAALKMRARRQIDSDQPQQAIQDLRVALEQAPQDPEILTLMAEAHEREGARELAGERLALAVEAANRAPEQSLRYARFLLQDERIGPAESVIVDALRGAPRDRDLLTMLAQIHLQRRDWDRALQVADVLRVSGDAADARAADVISASALRAQNRLDETAALLRDMVNDDSDVGALAGLLQTYVEAGDLDAARTLLDERLERDPDSAALRMMQAGLLSLDDRLDDAEALYREIIAAQPDYAPAYRTLFALLAAQDLPIDAAAVVDAGVDATRDPDLVFTKASLLETQEDFDGAIALYEELYAQNSASDLVANNLASLLTSHRSDPESLDRAFTIARRLRASNVPHFQDTYGWILTRRGDPRLALSYLEQAARALPENALVQYHLGMTYLALERWDEAETALQRAIAETDPESTLPQIMRAREEIAGIVERRAAAGQ